MKTMKDAEQDPARAKKGYLPAERTSISKLCTFMCSNMLTFQVQSLNQNQPAGCRGVESLMGPSQTKSWQMATFLMPQLLQSDA